MTAKLPDTPGSVPAALLGNTVAAVDWEAHRYGEGVLCEFRPRAEYRGCELKPGLAEKAGTRLVLRTMWLMDEDDSYPGEYALSSVDSCGGQIKPLGLDWVASGDVVPVRAAASGCDASSAPSSSLRPRRHLDQLDRRRPSE